MQSQRTPQVEKICVIGMGPTSLAFLASLLEKAKLAPEKKFEITVIEKRSAEFNRQQRLVDFPDNDLTSWESFLTNMQSSRHYVSQDGVLHNRDGDVKNPNARQKLMRQFLRQGIAATCRQVVIKNFSIKALQNSLLEHIKEQQLNEVSIHFHTETIVDEINLTNKTVTAQTKDGSKIQSEFDTFVVCEGVKRDVVQKINEAIKAEKIDASPFEFKPFDHQLPYHNVAGLLTIKLPDNVTNLPQYISKLRASFYLPKDQTIKKLSELGLTSSLQSGQLPCYVIDNNLYKSELDIQNWKAKVFIASEIPESLANLDDADLRHQKITAWLKIIASYRLQLPEECFDYIAKAKNENGLTMTLFHSEADYVNNPVMTLPNQAQIILLGDTSISPIPPIGRSSAIGLNKAMTAANCITKKNPIGKTHDFTALISAYDTFQRKIDNFLKTAFPLHSKPYSPALFQASENTSLSQKTFEEQNALTTPPPSLKST